jgi:hypothetical protein
MSHDERLERYLEGRESIEELPEPLRSEERKLLDLLGTVREDVRADPMLQARIMREVRNVRLSPWRRALDWLLQPRTIRVSPAAGGLAVATLTVAVLLVSGLRPSPLPTTAPPSALEPVTRFVFVAPEASTVELTGDFVDWDPEGIALQDERGTGVWTVDVPLEPGVYQYAFVVDGREWRPDPRAVSQVDDGFGRENSVVIVAEREL